MPNASEPGENAFKKNARGSNGSWGAELNKKKEKENTTKPMRECQERTPFSRFIRRMRAE